MSERSQSSSSFHTKVWRQMLKHRNKDTLVAVTVLALTMLFMLWWCQTVVRQMSTANRLRQAANEAVTGTAQHLQNSGSVIQPSFQENKNSQRLHSGVGQWEGAVHHGERSRKPSRKLSPGDARALGGSLSNKHRRDKVKEPKTDAKAHARLRKAGGAGA